MGGSAQAACSVGAGGVRPGRHAEPEGGGRGFPRRRGEALRERTGKAARRAGPGAVSAAGPGGGCAASGSGAGMCAIGVGVRAGAPRECPEPDRGGGSGAGGSERSEAGGGAGGVSAGRGRGPGVSRPTCRAPVWSPDPDSLGNPRLAALSVAGRGGLLRRPCVSLVHSFPALGRAWVGGEGPGLWESEHSWSDSATQTHSHALERRAISRNIS